MINKAKFYNLYNKNSLSNPDRFRGPIDAKLFLRDMSLPIAYFLAKKKTDANIVSIVYLTIGLLANFVFVFPGLISVFASLILHETAQLTDCVDGQIARYNGISSTAGRSFDSLISSLISGTFMISLGLKMFLETGNWVFLLFGGIGAFGKSFEHRLILDRQSLINQPFIKAIYYKSKLLKYSLYIFESIISEVRFFIALFFIFSALDIFFPGLNLATIGFLLYTVISVLENLVLTLKVYVRDLMIIEKKNWKGWVYYGKGN